MCGVIYFQGNSYTHKELLLNILKESQVRGLHAFGVALRKKEVEKFSVARFFQLKEAIEFIKDNDFYELIGHCRYDTSGDWHTLENNQPVVIGKNLLAFNGVVRMSTREEYQEEFQREYTTENDGEIPLRMMVESGTPNVLHLLEEKRVSFSGVFHVNGHTMAVRNERRPLWYVKAGEAKWIISTLDIWQRGTRAFFGSPVTRAIEEPFHNPPVVREMKPLEMVWLS